MALAEATTSLVMHSSESLSRENARHTALPRQGRRQGARNSAEPGFFDTARSCQDRDSGGCFEFLARGSQKIFNFS